MQSQNVNVNKEVNNDLPSASEACDVAAGKDINLSGRVGYRDDGFDIGYEDVEDVKVLS